MDKPFAILEQWVREGRIRLSHVRIHEAFINYMKDGLAALIRVDAAPQKLLKGHVKMVANIASALIWAYVLLAPGAEILRHLFR